MTFDEWMYIYYTETIINHPTYISVREPADPIAKWHLFNLDDKVVSSVTSGYMINLVERNEATNDSN